MRFSAPEEETKGIPSPTPWKQTRTKRGGIKGMEKHFNEDCKNLENKGIELVVPILLKRTASLHSHIVSTSVSRYSVAILAKSKF